MKKGNLLLAQSGGSTAVINASASGVISQALKSKSYDKVLCAHFGMHGILNQDFFDVSEISSEDLTLLSKTPASAFGSCRYKLPSVTEGTAAYEKVAEVFERNNVSCFIYIGGNDSMDTCDKIANYFSQISFPCKVVGVPKTVDNDLKSTHYCPGYGSAAKYIATTVHELALDTATYENGRITVCEVMGRDTGWLAAASAVANLSGHGADLIYLPECEFDTDRFLSDVNGIYRKNKHCLAIVSEGIKDKNGYVGVDNALDSFSHVQLGGISAALSKLITKELSVRTRAIDLGLQQRAAAHLMSQRDRQDAILCGEYAVNTALDGFTGIMAALTFDANNQSICKNVPLGDIANAVRYVPQEYISNDGHIADKFYNYVLPLIEGKVNLDYKHGIPLYFDSRKLKKYNR